MIRIAHASDTHEHPGIVSAVADVECDAIVLTGDILNNKGRVPATHYRIDPATECKYQNAWLRKVAKKWAAAFAGRPVIYVGGNHDFIGIERWLNHYGHTNLHVITTENPSVEVAGKRFAGFREVPWIAGEWVGETHDLRPCVERAMACNPDILVTHAPPVGILDGDDGYGVHPLSPALFYGEHKITHHLFGHYHRDGGKIMTENGIVFANAAGHLMVHDVP